MAGGLIGALKRLFGFSDNDMRADHAMLSVRQAASPAAAVSASVSQDIHDRTAQAAEFVSTHATEARNAVAGTLDLERERNPMTKVSMTVNGRAVSGDVSGTTLLVEFLREQLNLTGTHVGCDTSQCGACVIHIDGKAAKSCTMLAAQADGCTVTTIEGLAKGGELHPMQVAFHENHGLQCGFCTPGMIMSAVDMVNRARETGTELDEASIRAGLEGNICRCTGYHNIVRAIEQGAKAMA